MLRLAFIAIMLGMALQVGAQRKVRITRRYQRKGYANKVTANVPNLLIAADCVGLSVGLEYERFVSKKGNFSVTLPIYAFIGNTFFMGGARVGDIDRETQGMYAMPGVMYHPFGNTRRIDFAFGPAIMLGSIHYKDREVGTFAPSPKNVERTEGLVGLMASFSMTIHSSSAFVFSPHLEAGAMSAGAIQSAVVQVGLKIGGRF